MDLALLPSLIFGALLIAGGGALLYSHSRTWQRQQVDGALDKAERDYLARRYRRRMQVAGLIVLIGLLIPLGDVLFSHVLPKRRGAVFLPIYFGGVLFLGGWVGVLGFMDWLSTLAHTRAALARTEVERRLLEKKLNEFKSAPAPGNHEWN